MAGQSPTVLAYDAAMPLPQLDGTIRVGGLRSTVEVVRDGSGIPHVRASSADDAFFGQGFVHAQDRLWQMEYDRRRASGRLAELLGSRAVTLDVFARRMDINSSAQADHDALDDTTGAMLDAYTAGVNAFIDSGAPPPREFELLGIAAPRWEAWQCGAVFKIRHVLMGTYDSKLWRARLAHALGSRGAIVPGSAHGRDDLLIVPVGAEETFVASESDALATASLPDGSNNWAVHGSRTASGRPLVAGDPHRAIEAPNVYYQNHVSCPEFDAIGFSMAGVPGMFHFGHNARVAWCVTHGMADIQDLFVERFDASGRYEFQGELREPEHRRETIHVRDADDVEIDAYSTHHGPVLFGDPASGTAIALRWTGTDAPNASLRAVRRMLDATTTDELDDTMRDWVDPCNNLVMADTDGNIAYLYRGRTPVRSRANAWTPVAGWTADHEWNSDIPFDELPRLRNPDEGLIVTANNRVVGSDYPYLLGMDYSQPGRARRVLDRLLDLERATAHDMATVHADRMSLPARAIAPEFARNAPADVAAILRGWDGTMDPGSVAATIYATVRHELARVLTEREPLSAAVPDPYVEDPYPTPAMTRVRTALPRIIATEVLAPDEWDDAIRDAVDRALTMLRDELGPQTDDWTWDRVHCTRVVHPLARTFPHVADELNPPSVSMGGDGDCVQAGSAELGTYILHSSVARYVFDLADWDNSGWIVPGGSSGHPESPHYSDQLDDWAATRLRPMLYSADAIDAGAESRQVLEPAR
jgi:penicillin amidase